MTATNLKEEFMTEKEVANALGIKVATLRNRIYSGTNHPPYIPGREKLFPVAEFRKWLMSRMEKETRAS